MPETSALTLLPPSSLLNAASPNYSPSTDTSFQDSLATAQQRQSSTLSSTTDATPDDETTTPTSAAPSKKSAKKPKAKTTAKNAPVETDSSETNDVQETANPPTPEDIHPDSAAAQPKEKTDESDDHADPKSETDTKISIPVSVESATAQPQATKATASPAIPLKSPDRKPIVKSLSTDQQKTATSASPSKANNPTDTSTQTATTASDPTTAPAPKTAPFCADTADSAKTPQDSDDQNKAEVHAVNTTPSADPAAQTAALPQPLPSDLDPDTAPRASAIPDASPLASNFDQQLQRALQPLASKSETPAPAPSTPESQFVDSNHPTIVSNVHTQLLPNGGTMQLRLDPPDLGSLQLTVQMRDGALTASFETSNDQATRMLSHSLTQLKAALETTGVTVERMHVQQAPRSQSSSSNSDSQSQQQSTDPEQQQQSRQDQQRRQMLQKMWNKLSGQSDPLDLVA